MIDRFDRRMTGGQASQRYSGQGPPRHPQHPPYTSDQARNKNFFEPHLCMPSQGYKQKMIKTRYANMPKSKDT